MYGEIFALLLSIAIIFVTLIKAHTSQVCTHYCRKSEIPDLLKDLSDDTVIQILVRKEYP